MRRHEGEADLAQRLLECSPTLVMIVDQELNVTWANEAIERLFGYTKDEIVGTNVAEHLAPDIDPLALDSVGAALGGSGLRRPMRFPVVRKDGRRFECEVTANSQLDDPAIGGLAVYVRRWDERLLLDKIVETIVAGDAVESTLGLVVEFIGSETIESDGAVFHGAAGRGFDHVVAAPGLPAPLDGRPVPLGTATPWFVARDTREVQVLTVDELDAPLHDAAEHAGYRICWAWPVEDLTDQTVAACLVVWRRDDEAPDHTCTMTMNQLARLTALVLDRNRTVAQMHHAATHDPLTDLPNRARFFDHLQDLVEQPPDSAPVGVLYLDLDGFKPVNDRLGHGVGDAVLRAVALRLSGAVRDGDLVARLGGDEFGVLCPDIDDLDDLTALAGRLVAAVADPVQVGDEQVTIGVSAGISLARPGSCSIDAVVEAADAALYEVKAAGKGGWRLADGA
jgi:diguanylate cyclase (GGDEF)-like protein/PAS domain S-box-containing protein